MDLAVTHPSDPYRAAQVAIELAGTDLTCVIVDPRCPCGPAELVEDAVAASRTADGPTDRRVSGRRWRTILVTPALTQPISDPWRSLPAAGYRLILPAASYAGHVALAQRGLVDGLTGGPERRADRCVR